MKTTNCKQVIESVQNYLLEWMDDYKQSDPEIANDSNDVAFAKTVGNYMKLYGTDPSWGTPRGVLNHFVEGGCFECYYSQVNERLKEWGLNPERYTDETNWATYKNLICRDGERLYNKITK